MGGAGSGKPPGPVPGYPNLHPIQKGSPALNPGGRPKMPDHLKKRFKEMSEDAVTLLQQALTDPGVRMRERLLAAQIVLDRAYGKPQQQIDVDAGIGIVPIMIPEVLQNEFNQVLQRNKADREARESLRDVNGESECTPVRGSPIGEDVYNSLLPSPESDGIPYEPAPSGEAVRVRHQGVSVEGYAPQDIEDAGIPSR